MSDASNLEFNPIVMRRARSYEDLLGLSTSQFRAFDINNVSSIRTCGVWRDRAFLDQTAFINDPSPLYENGGELDELLAQYAFSHKIPFKNSLEINPLEVITLPQYPTRHITEFSPFAEIALDYFNCEHDADFKLVEITRVGYKISYPKSTIHVNFDAKSKFGKLQMFYAELKTTSLNKVEENEVLVEGCAILTKVDTGNPLGVTCMICHDKVIHPGPKDGYKVLVGDNFKESRFWLYRPSTGLNCSIIREDTIRYMEKYIVFAMKAVKFLNRKVEADWELLVVTGVVDRMEKCRKIFHMNFTVKSSNANNEIKLCFAELILPLFNGHSPDNWTMEKEPFLEINGCCIMEKDANYESPLGRVCAMCTGGLIHPGPKYGYRVLVGDEFAMYDFKTYGNGVF